MEASFYMPTVDALSVSTLVRSAFSARIRPLKATDSLELSHDEQDNLREIFQLEWQETTAADWERLADVVSWLSPKAFCYYLPGIIVATTDENCPFLLAACSVLFMLDRTPSIELWDSFFFDRGTLLNTQELEAVSEWISWLSGLEDCVLDDISLTRALLNIDLLAARLKI